MTQISGGVRRRSDAATITRLLTEVPQVTVPDRQLAPFDGTVGGWALGGTGPFFG
ncbi:hypothetical protein [Streptomyces mirabilis]|uniref:hypothetical protein n=1 Tax=Streptomyces mirabilis TaxID=68239 RepID=UPI0036AAACAB